MPELFFKGKEFVYNHHLAVPFRPLIPDPTRSVGESGKQGRLDGNLIIHGDNLHALKALLPMYARQVDCIFIDPPYNTGNEGWCYNDNVNGPMIREWLSSNPVGIEDGLRYDKWLAMMWPRLRLLHELLSERGSLWMTLDDNEVHRARSMLDEVFGEEHFVATCIWHKMDSPKNTAQFFSVDHDYLIVYARDIGCWDAELLPRTDEMLARYQNPDNDPRGPWLLGDLDARNKYSKGVYPIATPSGRTTSGPPRGKYWRISAEKLEALDDDNRIWWGPDGNSEPGIKRFLSEVKDGVVTQTIWHWKAAGSTRNAKAELLNILGKTGDEHEIFITPKPSSLIERVLAVATKPESIVLDSFAGSGTTAHAVLAANAKDGGNRRFILVECEDYADTLTAERVRRVINGYSFNGTQREELHRERLTFTSLKKADKLLAQVESIKNLEDHRFDRIKSEVKDGELVVRGERDVTEKTQGLGGSFTYCTLGEPIELDALLTGDNLPGFEQLGNLLFHIAANEARPAGAASEEVAGCGYLGESPARHVWLIYRPGLDFLKSPESALTLSRARAIAEAKPGKSHLVYAAARFVSQRALNEAGLAVEFAPLPFALYRVERD